MISGMKFHQSLIFTAKPQNKFENIYTTKSLLLFKGRLGFKQYVLNKRNRFGIKLFFICDFKCGHISDFIIYTGADKEIKVNDKFV